MRKIDDTMFVSGQVRPVEVAGLAAAGIAMIVNNRPDGEQPGQPPSDQLAKAAEVAGIEYRAIPVSGGSVSQAQVDAMISALDAASGPVLAFCAAGMRSSMLWALARAQAGDDRTDILGKAAQAGYDLSPIAAYLQQKS